MPGIRPTREIKPVGVRSFGDTVYVFDFGENMSGLCRLKISGERGMKVEMQHGELLKDNGRVEMRNIDIYYDPMPGLGFQTDDEDAQGRRRGDLHARLQLSRLPVGSRCAPTAR